MPPFDRFPDADENHNPLSAYTLDDPEPGRPPTHHHLDNAITSLCLALQWAKEGRTANHLINALRMCANAKFGRGPL